MAVTITTDLTILYNANTAFGGGSVYTGFQRFGTGCNGSQVSNATAHFTGAVTSFTLVGRSIYSWMNGPGSIGTLAQGGYRIVIGDGTNTRAYYVGGRDVKTFFTEGWFCFVLNGDNLPTLFQQLAGAAQPNLSAITLVGIGFTTTAKAQGNSPNVFWDVARVGTGLTIGGGTIGDPGTFADIVVQERSLSNAWGILEDLGGGTFGCQGKLTIGSTNSASTFIDSGKTLVFEDRLVGTDYYVLNIIGSVSNDNIFTLGEKVGIGDDAVGINGVTITSSGTIVGIDLSTINSDVNIYGSTFNNLGNNIIDLPGKITSDFISNTFNRTGVVNSGICIIRNCFFINTSSTLASFSWDGLSTNIKNSSFIGNTVSPAVLYTISGTYEYDSLIFIGNTTDIFENIVLLDDLVTINAINGSNPTTFIGNVVINNPTIFRVINIVADSEVRIFRTSDRFELAGVESSGTFFEYQYNYGADITTFLVVHKETYEYIKIPDIILSNDDQTITVQQRFDRNFIP